MNKKRHLSAKPYIINNKTRILVLIISFSLFITMLYGISFLFSTSTETFYDLMVDRYKNFAIITLNLPEGSPSKDYIDSCQQLCNQLSTQRGVRGAIPTSLRYDVSVNAVIGHLRLGICFMDQEYITFYLEQYNASLIDGKLPKYPGEIVINQRLQKNTGLKIGDAMIEDHTIVGIVESDSYLALGVNKYFDEVMCTAFLDSDADIYEICKSANIPYDYMIRGIQEGKDEFDNSSSIMTFSANLITITATILLFICLLVVIQMHFRDRQEEWCLYNSIGYSLWDIYCLAMRELLLTILIGVFFGFVLSGCFMIILNYFIIVPKGLFVSFLLPKTINEIVCILVLFVGCCQLPLMHSLHQIRTVDTLESES